MPSVLNLLPGAVGQAPTQTLHGQVSSLKPAPSTFTDPLYVVVPDWDPDYFHLVTDWPASHGSTLPAQGAACHLALDNRGTMRCLWWDSPTTAFSPTGTATGDLAGDYPAPTVTRIQGKPVSGSAPSTTNNGLVWNGTSWTPTPVVQADTAGKPIVSQTANSATAGANGAVPAQVAGYILISITGTTYKVPYFNA